MVVADRLLAPVAVAQLQAAVLVVVAAELLLQLAAAVVDAVAKSPQHLQREPFAARFGFLTLLPKKFL